MSLSTDQLVHDLVEYGLLPAGEIEPVQQSLSAKGRAPTAQELARELVTRGKLTAFQANAAYAGRAKGLTLGPYLVIDKIGAGGMGQVFKAEHRRMHRTVAIKVLPRSAVSSPDSVQRFQREVQAAARLEHPNIVMAFDAAEAGGLHFLVMQFIDGEDLSKLTRGKGGLPVDTAVDYTIQAARGLAFAHAHGVVHRDVKPANLLVDRQGCVKILDLGLARLDNPPTDTQLTSAGQVMGTADYMAPEQGTDIQKADARSDIYSLGCTLFLLLTGREMYPGGSAIDKVVAHRTQPPPSLVKVRSEVPAALERVYERMVAKRPEERYASMDEVVAALDQCRSTKQVNPPPLPAAVAAAIPTAVAWSPAAATAVAAGMPGVERARAETMAGGQTALATASQAGGSRMSWLVALAGTMFATVVAPIVVALALKYGDKVLPGDDDDKPTPAAAQVVVSPIPSTPAPATTPAPAAAKQVIVTPPAPPPTVVASSTPAVQPTKPAAQPVTAPPPAPKPPAVPPIRLFNGVNLSGWYTFIGPSDDKPALGKGKDPAHLFHVFRGMLHISGKRKGVLETESGYNNYRLTLSYKWGDQVVENERQESIREAGVLLHCLGPDTTIREQFPSSVRCILSEGHTGDLVPLATEQRPVSFDAEVERRPMQTLSGRRPNLFFEPGHSVTTFNGSNGVVRGIGSRAPLELPDGKRQLQLHEHPIGVWNSLEITCQRDTIVVKLNNTLVNRVTGATHRQGRIGLQSLNAEIIFRSIELELLP